MMARCFGAKRCRPCGRQRFVLADNVSQRLSGKGSAWSPLGKLAATWPPTFPPKTLYAIRFYGAKLELAATRHTRSDSGSHFGCRRPHIGCNIRFANILWSLSCRPAKTGGPVGPSLSGQPQKGGLVYHTRN